MRASFFFCTAIAAGTFFVQPARATITTTGNLSPPYDGTDPWNYGPSEVHIGDVAPGTLSITSGSSVSFGHAGIITDTAAAAVSSVSVDGSGSTWQATSIIVGNAGAGTLHVANGGKVTNTTNVIIIGDSAAAESNATVDGNGSSIVVKTELDVGLHGTGSLDITNGGAVSFVSGSGNPTYVGAGNGGVGTVAVGGGLGSSTLNSNYLHVGYGGIGTLNITGGGVVSDTGIPPNTLVQTTIGAGSGASGVVNVGGGIGSATWSNSGDMAIGASGTGTLNVMSGGSVSDANVTIGVNSGGIGIVTVGGGSAGSIWTTTGKLTVGGNGNGTLNINSGGTVSASALDAGSGSPGDFDKNGVIDGADYNLWRAAFGSKTSLATDANNNGVVDMADYVVWRNAANINSVVNFNGGKLSITATDSSSSSFTLLANGGTIDVPTLGSAFTITSAISGVGAGALMKVGAGELEPRGANTFGGPANVNGGILAANGSLSGGVNVSSGAILDGVGSARGVVTVKSGGTIVPGNPTSNSNRVGTLTVGSLILNAGAATDIEIEGAVAGSGGYDVLSVNGVASLGGSLNVVGSTLIASGYYSPAVGQTFDILTATGGVSGTFSTPETTWVTGGERVHYSIAYGLNKVTLQVTAVDTLTQGDFDGDGKVDMRDYVVWRDTLGTPLSAADADHNGIVNATDYSLWRAHFGTGVGAGADLAANVPEPVSWMFAVISFLAASSWRGGARQFD